MRDNNSWQCNGIGVLLQKWVVALAIGIGGSYQVTPLPPSMPVRTGPFEELRLSETGQPQTVEVGSDQHPMDRR